eukprot:TRINITY_DN3438_c0_g2_i1.p1 TRINITY_DN3438_c0_g2~~TRINITY_DN3438_c0_g2_i1.p1  ORF type:complete len:979 (-),score=241.97 TRINITY_DN3438_c0_g2_i1:95-2662(-)
MNSNNKISKILNKEENDYEDNYFQDNSDHIKEEIKFNHVDIEKYKNFNNGSYVINGKSNGIGNNKFQNQLHSSFEYQKYKSNFEEIQPPADIEEKTTNLKESLGSSFEQILKNTNNTEEEDNEYECDTDMLQLIKSAEITKKLKLSNLGLDKIPSSIWNYKELVELDLSANQLKRIGKELSMLSSLKLLALNHNSLSKLPNALWKLTSLRKLYLNNNNLKAIPNEIKNLEDLRVLDFSCNNISGEVPSVVTGLTNLVDLKLRKNQITDLPSHMYMLTNLKALSITENPLREPPKSIINKGTSAILTYYQEKKRFSREKVNKKNWRTLDAEDKVKELQMQLEMVEKKLLKESAARVQAERDLQKMISSQSHKPKLKKRSSSRKRRRNSSSNEDKNNLNNNNNNTNNNYNNNLNNNLNNNNINLNNNINNYKNYNGNNRTGNRLNSTNYLSNNENNNYNDENDFSFDGLYNNNNNIQNNNNVNNTNNNNNMYNNNNNNNNHNMNDNIDNFNNFVNQVGHYPQGNNTMDFAPSPNHNQHKNYVNNMEHNSSPNRLNNFYKNKLILENKKEFSHKSPPRPSPEKENCAWEIEKDDLIFKRKLGRGGYGEVYKGLWRGTEVAIKKLFVDPKDDSWKGKLGNEVDVLCKLRHPNIVLFMGACTTSSEPLIVTEYLKGGSLADILTDKTVEIDYILKLEMAMEISRGMIYLHKCKPIIIHRDLKTDNLLVDDNWHIKIADFGLSKLKERTYAVTTCGTTGYVAPEILKNQPYSEKVDAYSFGVVLWELLTREVPYADMNTLQIVNCIGKGESLDIPLNCPDDYRALMEECWEQDPLERPGFEYILIQLESILDRYQDKDDKK